MRAALDNPEDARLRQAGLEAARAGRERMMMSRPWDDEMVLDEAGLRMGTWTREYEVNARSDTDVDLDRPGLSGDPPTSPVDRGASAEAALPQSVCRVHGCWRRQTSGHMVCSYHVRLGVTI